MTQATRITFVRHGEVHNPRHVIYGRLPRFHLSARGREQARSTAALLNGQPVDALFCSPMLRARQTARAIQQQKTGLQLSVSGLLNEVLTPYQGCIESEVDCPCGDFYTGSAPNFEQPADVLERVQRFARRAARLHPGGHVVAVTHGDPIAFFALWAGGAPVTPANKTRLAPLGIAGGYPAHAAAVTYVVPSAAESVPRLLSYRTP